MSAAPRHATAQGADYTPHVCPRGVEYSGPPLRNPLLEAAFAQGAAESKAFDPATTARLDAAFERARLATGARTMSASVMAPGRGSWQTNFPIPQGDPPLQYWASVGKAFTAVVILQLAEEGRLSLDDHVSKWIDGVPNGEAVTIRHLLTHTSGLFSVNEDLVVRTERRRLSLEETLAVLRRHGTMFCPGENWRYSNTGYTLLGVILERTEGKPYDQIITDRIISRLGDVRLRALTPDDALTDVSAPAPANNEPPIDPREPGAAGGIVGDAEAMIEFWRSLLAGDLVSLATVRSQFAMLYPMFGDPQSYGMGVMTYELPNPSIAEPLIWVGHSGGAPGVKAIVAYSLADGAFVAVALSGDGSVEASANLLLRQLRIPANPT
jgi:D-alanyl-D-alanine carboxypeptidase